MVSKMVARITPRAIMSLLNLSNKKKIPMFKIAPKVMIFPKSCCALKTAIPSMKRYGVNTSTKA